MAKLKAQAVDSYANFASLPAPTSGIFEIAVTSDSNILYISNGTMWIAAGGGGSSNLDGGQAGTVYGGTTAIDGGNA